MFYYRCQVVHSVLFQELEILVKILQLTTTTVKAVDNHYDKMYKWVSDGPLTKIERLSK